MKSNGPFCVYIVRHGHINTSGRFVSREDLPLSSKGREQAVRLASVLSETEFSSCLCSPMLRCKETARAIMQFNTSLAQPCVKHFFQAARVADVPPGILGEQAAQAGSYSVQTAAGDNAAFFARRLECEWPDHGVADSGVMAGCLVPELLEISLGDWEGMTKGQIQSLYGELWRRRGQYAAETSPPGGEDYAMLLERLQPVLTALFSLAHVGNVLLVAHRSVNQVLVGYLSGLPLRSWPALDIPYGSVTICPMRQCGPLI